MRSNAVCPARSSWSGADASGSGAAVDRTAVSDAVETIGVIMVATAAFYRHSRGNTSENSRTYAGNFRRQISGAAPRAEAPHFSRRSLS
jgi:hypothetical protein